MKYIFLHIRTIFFNVSANSLKRTDEPYNGMNGGTLDDGEGGDPIDANLLSEDKVLIKSN